MKSTRVPAQITTVEDKIAGNLSFTQILLLIAALFFSTFVYLVFPSPMKFTLYKLPLMAVLSIVFLMLAVRIRGKVILNWIFLITTYSLRPRYYVFNKNDMTQRELIVDEQVKKVKSPAKQKAQVKQKSQVVPIPDLVAVEQVFSNPHQAIQLIFKKGGINVRVSENK